MTDYDDLIKQLGKLGTEQVNPDTVDIDRLAAEEIARKINTEDHKVANVVQAALPSIAKAAEIFAETLRQGGRVFYVGAGTSGRLGVLDAAECPPTFGTDPAQIVGVISGGYETLVLSREGVEDRREATVSDLENHGLDRKDFVIGIAASRRTPYTLSGLEFAQSMGAHTAYIICNRPDEACASDAVIKKLDVLVSLPVGPEVITGSTRMKSGSAQKMTLNTISTTAMVLLGKTYGNLMVDLQARSEKLHARSRKILMDLFDMDSKAAESLLKGSGGSVKTAMVMHKLDCTCDEAERRLKAAGGFVSHSIES